jgi:hypothetical protein
MRPISGFVYRWIIVSTGPARSGHYESFIQATGAPSESAAR